MRFSIALVLLTFISPSFANEGTFPRFASLRSDKVNARIGPNFETGVKTIYSQVGLPVEITAEHDGWKRVRDWEGTEGWVQNTQIAEKRRMIMTRNLKNGETHSIFSSASLNGEVTAKIEPFINAQVKKCDKKACFVEHKEFKGWIDQTKVWGVYPNEVF